jgi:hypothetical protein
MSNTTPCKGCAHWDEQKKFEKGAPASFAVPYGWCAKKSVYPTKDQDNQQAPDGAARAPFGELAKPVIVYGDQVVVECLDVLVK